MAENLLVQPNRFRSWKEYILPLNGACEMNP
jgi:hypothetical protein